MGIEFLSELKLWFDSITDPARDLPDEAECRCIYGNIRFGSGTFACPRCGSTSGHRTADHGWRCNCCDRRVSVTAGTLSTRTKQQLRWWLAGVWYETKSENGISALRFMQLYGCPSYGPIWRMLHRIRECFAGTQRAHVVTSAPPATACIHVLGRRRPKAEGLQAWLALGLNPQHLEHATGRTRAEALARLTLPPEPDNATALLMAESFRSYIVGTHHGVRRRYLALYARAFFGRWSGSLCPIDVLRRLLGCEPHVPHRASWPTEDELARLPQPPPKW